MDKEVIRKTEQIKSLALIPRRPSFYVRQIPSVKTFDYSKEEPHFLEWVKKQYKDTKIPENVYLSIDSEFSEAVRRYLEQVVTSYSDARIADGAALVFDLLEMLFARHLIDRQKSLK